MHQDLSICGEKNGYRRTSANTIHTLAYSGKGNAEIMIQREENIGILTIQ